MTKDPFKELCDLLDKSGARMCFCTLCSHDPKYGHCYACHCGNHVAEPDCSGDICALQETAQDYGRQKSGLTSLCCCGILLPVNFIATAPASSATPSAGISM